MMMILGGLILMFTIPLLAGALWLIWRNGVHSTDDFFAKVAMTFFAIFSAISVLIQAGA